MDGDLQGFREEVRRFMAETIPAERQGEARGLLEAERADMAWWQDALHSRIEQTGDHDRWLVRVVTDNICTLLQLT